MKEYYEEIQGNGQDVLTGYASLTNDYMFKRVFGSEECKDILIQFLNDIVAGPTIVDVKIQNAGVLPRPFSVLYELSDHPSGCAGEEELPGRAWQHGGVPLGLQSQARDLCRHHRLCHLAWCGMASRQVQVAISDS